MPGEQIRGRVAPLVDTGKQTEIVAKPGRHAGQIQVGRYGDVMDFKQRLWHKPLNRNTSESVNLAETTHHRQADYARASAHAVIFGTRPLVEFFKTRDCFLETVITA
jgi:hypothetical protein